MSEKSEALRLADALDECKYVDVYRCKQAAAKLRRLSAENETLKAQRDALLRILKSELQHAEWRDKIIYPSGGEEFQNWMISIYLPVPLSASDKSPETALDRFVAAAIAKAEGRT